MNPDQILAQIGKFDLTVEDEYGSRNSSVMYIVVHPDWNFNKEPYDADIAVIGLDDPIEYSNFIQPICLPTTSYADAEGTGVVSGWGKSRSDNNHDTRPSKLELPVVNSTHCYPTFPKLAASSSRRMFCGGFENQNKAPCTGDSGGGFYIKDESTKSFLKIIGIVSGSLTTLEFGCDPNKFSLYTNVARFVDWITMVMKGPLDFECGQRRRFSGLIFGGEKMSRGEFPWMVAFHHIEFDQFFCAGTLISKKHVLTGDVYTLIN